MELSLDRLTKQYGRKIAVDCISATLKQMCIRDRVHADTGGKGK